MEIDKLQFTPVIQSQDILNLAHMAKEIWEEHYTPIIGKDQVDYMLEKFQSGSAIQAQISDNYSYYTVQKNNQAIGYLSYSINDETPSLFLSKIYLKKANRGEGLGRQMMQFIIQKAKELNCQYITLTVNKYNEKTILAYQKYGFVKKRELIIDIGNGFIMDDFEMIYEIK